MVGALALGAVVGLILGLLGGGGSLLAVPLLVHVLGLHAREAVAASLGAVGLAALSGAVVHARAGAIDGRAALAFGLLGALGSLAGAQLARLVSEHLQLGLFAAVTLLAGALMLRPRRESEPQAQPERARWPIVPAAVGSGALTGFLGVGGGFIVVPALVLAAGLPMRRAVGTSLLVLGVTALAGFAGYAPHLAGLSGTTLAFSAGATLCAPLGALLADRTPQARLRRGFGVVLVLVSLATLAQVLRS